NITRDAMRRLGWSPSVRLFEAAACGTPIISDIWPGLTDLLPQDSAVLLAEGSDDVVAALTELDDDNRRRIARRARQIVLSDHTGRARARDLMRALDSAAWAAAPAGTTAEQGARACSR
ncbi:MAG: glycosyltransferase family 1 protein, partial [Alphaproteobacteria bacterium]|nr:glycosyltransferase family 1 protein [Alphaproteobacteria bacterium]